METEEGEEPHENGEGSEVTQEQHGNAAREMAKTVRVSKGEREKSHWNHWHDTLAGEVNIKPATSPSPTSLPQP